MRAVIFDVDGTLLDSVDLHALAWQEAFAEFGHDVGYDNVRSQIGKGGDKLVPAFLSEPEIRDHGDALEKWRSERFKGNYLSLLRPFTAVPDLLKRVRSAGLKIGIASSAKRDELERYLDIAGVAHLVDGTTSAEDVDDSKPDPDVFEAILGKLGVDVREAVAVGDTPYDAKAAGRAGIACIGVLCGGFSESLLTGAGCRQVFVGPSTMLACFDRTIIAS